MILFIKNHIIRFCAIPTAFCGEVSLKTGFKCRPSSAAQHHGRVRSGLPSIEKLGSARSSVFTWAWPILFVPLGYDLPQEGNIEFVTLDHVDGMEVYVNPDRVIWIREHPNKATVISCGHDNKFSVRLHPAQALAMLGKLPSEPKARFQSIRDSQA